MFNVSCLAVEKREDIMQCPLCGYNTDSKERSLPQNKYYFGVVLKELSELTGDSKEQWHEMIKRKFLTEYHIVKSKNGQIEKMESNRSTKELNTKEWEDLMSRIRIWASSHLGIWIPEPNEVINES